MANVQLNITVSSPTVTRFTVGGKTLAEAQKALDARDEWGLYDATQNVRSSAKTDGDGNVVSVTLALNPKIQMPAWSGYSSATKDQKDSWDAMYRALLAHENKHHALQLACVEDLKKAIKAIKDLDAQALKDCIDDQKDACQKKQDAYDSRSGHGANEGVVLDLSADPSPDDDDDDSGS